MPYCSACRRRGRFVGDRCARCGQPVSANDATLNRIGLGLAAAMTAVVALLALLANFHLL